jgi:beta-lactamase class A
MDLLGGDALVLTEEIVTERFAPSLLEQVPPNQLIATLEQVVGELGPLTLTGFFGEPSLTEAVGQVETRGGDVYLLSIAVEPEPPHRMTSLLIQQDPSTLPTPTPLGSWDELDPQLRALAPQVNFLAAELIEGECRPVHGLNAADRLGLGSTFKLYVLGALANQVEQGAASWDEEVAIQDALKSLPSGTMQDEPEGTTHTLREFAEQMISISDNTATDHLLDRLGRENVEAFQTTMGHLAPTRNIPFLSTRELFILKLKLDDEQRAAYLNATTEDRRAMLGAFAASYSLALSDALSWNQPIAIEELEWFASAEELCRAMLTLRDMSTRPGLEPLRDILSINPGIPFDEADWAYSGFKGGSEPGVLNLTWLLQRADGRWFVLTAGFNNPSAPLDENVVIPILQAAVALLAEEP